MILELLIAILLGCFTGIITGLTPGLHINLVAVLTFSASYFLLNFISPVTISVFIIAMSITHTFLDALPSIFLGAPDSDQVLSVLPGHRLLLEGRGYEAVMLTAIGSLAAVILTLMITPLLIPFVKFTYPLIKDYIPYILIISSIFLISKEHKSRLLALIIFLLSGTLGIAVFNLPTLKQPLLPLLSGLFGISILIVSLSEKSKIPPQKITNPNLDKKESAKVLSSGLITSSLCGFLPGIGPAEAAIIASSPFRKITSEYFLLLTGAINTVVMVISFIALYTIDKARNGSVVIISKIMEKITFSDFIIFLAATLASAFIAYYLTKGIARIFSSIITKINYQKLCIGIIIFIVAIVIILTGPLGLSVLIISTAFGIVPSLLGIAKNHMMGCLIIPVILYFLL